jgi:hypothetical protein
MGHVVVTILFSSCTLHVSLYKQTRRSDVENVSVCVGYMFTHTSEVSRVSRAAWTSQYNNP